MHGICCRRGGFDERQLRLSFPALLLGSAVTDAELQHDSWDYRSSRSSVGMQFMMMWRKRTQSVQKGMRRRASHDNELSVQADAGLQHDS